MNLSWQDIDVVLVNDYEKLFDYPIEKGEFLSIPDGA